MGDWESIFKKIGKVFVKPQEDIKNVIKLIKKEGVKRVLDLGCGTGRHTILLAKAGFDVYATDISKTGLQITKKRTRTANLKVKIKEASCYKKFPFKNNFFDAVISTQVIHHNYHNKIKQCISEIVRVLKTGGIVFITVAAKKNKRGATASRLVAPRIYIPIDGNEAGLPHFLYTKALMKKDFNKFKILDIHKDSGDHYCLLGKLKI